MTPKEEWIEERAAIMQYDAGMSPMNALAAAQWLARFYGPKE